MALLLLLADDSYLAVKLPEYPSYSSVEFEKITNRTEASGHELLLVPLCRVLCGRSVADLCWACDLSQRLEFQFQALDQQLKAVYAGMALAYLFNRSIILPRITCYCDRSESLK